MQQLDIAAQYRVDAGAQHRDDDIKRLLLALDSEARAMHLRDRRRRHRHVIEFGEYRVNWLAEFSLNDLSCLRGRKRRHAILQAGEFDRNVGRHQIGARRQRLPELDEDRTAFFERKAQPHTARAWIAARPAADEFLKTVAARHAADLPDPPQAAATPPTPE